MPERLQPCIGRSIFVGCWHIYIVQIPQGIILTGLPNPEIDVTSDTWRVIKALAEKKLSELRLRNEQTMHGEVETMRLRSAIHEWKSILALGDPPSPGNLAGDGDGRIDHY